MRRQRLFRQRNRHVTAVFTTVFMLALGLYGGATAEEIAVVPEADSGIKALQQVQGNPAEYSSDVQAEWEMFLDKQGWREGLNPGEIIIQSGYATTAVPLGQPGWIESRIVAHERAELNAKAKLARFLSTEIDASRAVELFEKASWSTGTLQRAQQLSRTEETLWRLRDKTLTLADKALDAIITEFDSSSNPDQFKLPEAKIKTLEDRFQRRLRLMASVSISGAMPLISIESGDSRGYEILVGLIWSPNLNRLAMNLMDDTYTMPSVEAGRRIEEVIPTDPQGLIAMLGTRIVVNDKGQRVVLSYGQAAPRITSKARERAAVHTAHEIAQNRALGSIAYFAAEKATLAEIEESQELAQEFADLSAGAENIRDFQQRIQGQAEKLTIRGVTVAKRWVHSHPTTGQMIAGTVIAWTPEGMAMAESMREAMQERAMERAGPIRSQESEVEPSEQKIPILKSPMPDKHAF